MATDALAKAIDTYTRFQSAISGVAADVHTRHKAKPAKLSIPKTEPMKGEPK